MSWIDEIEEDAADRELAGIYNDMKRSRGKVANIMKAQSLDPRAMKAHLDLYMSLMFTRSGITRAEAEMLAVAVSSANGCDYCISHHAEALRAHWKDDARVNALVRNPASAGLEPRERAMVDHALKLTRTPGAVTEKDILTLRNAGLDDREILRVSMITAYFNFVNRLALGLGVEFSEEEMRGYRV